MDKKKINCLARLELARRDFFFYCQTKAPTFYKADREYLVKLCKELQSFIQSKDDILIINVPPRHGKSRTSQLLVEWILGRDITRKIMTGSYNETVATQFSKGVRNSIQEIKAEEGKIVYSDIFPKTRIKEGDGASNLWSLEGGHANYLATSPTGTATGFGADILIIDDVIKNAEEANNATILEKHWDWLNNTMLSRLESGGKMIIVMTRWHTKDIAGRILAEYPSLGYKIKHIAMKALQPNGEMLCESILSRTEYERKIKSMGEDIASANYQQEPIDIKGRLYTRFKTYADLPKDKDGDLLFDSIKLYSDTADTGRDYLCNIIYGTYRQEAYILDVYYTRDPMEVTEKVTAERLLAYGVNRADIESNNGGRGFSRAVERRLRDLGSTQTVFRPFHQSKNKESRILTNATWIMEHMYFPVNWRDRWPEYYTAMYEYQRDGDNKYDDAPDATTGVAENTMRKKLYSF